MKKVNKKRDLIMVLISLCVLLVLLCTGYLQGGNAFLIQLAMLICGFFLVYGLLGLVSSNFRKMKIPVKVIKLVMWICVSIVAVLFVTVEYFIITGEKTDTEIPDVEYMVVLGAGVNGETPSMMLTERLNTAYDYLSKNPECKAVLCGGRGRGENITEAEAMYRWLKEKGIDASRLYKEEASTDTKENIINAKEIMRENGYKGKDLIIVTTGFHLFRSDMIAEENGYTAYKLSAKLPDLPFMWLNYHCREFVSVMLFYLTGSN